MGQERHVSYYWHGTVCEWTGGVGLGVVKGMDTLFILRSPAWWGVLSSLLRCIYAEEVVRLPSMLLTL